MKKHLQTTLADALNAHPVLAEAVRNAECPAERTDLTPFYARYVGIRERDAGRVTMFFPRSDREEVVVAQQHDDLSFTPAATGEQFLALIGMTASDVLVEHLLERADELIVGFGIHDGLVAGISHVSEVDLQGLSVRFMMDPSDGADSADSGVPEYGLTIRLEGHQDVLYLGDPKDGVRLMVRDDAAEAYCDPRRSKYLDAGLELQREIKAKFLQHVNVQKILGE